MGQTVLVSGATGFIGRRVVRFLQSIPECRVIATGRNEEPLRALGVEYAVYDLSEHRGDCYELLGRPDALIHLAWDGLPNYHELFHVERNLMDSYRFLKAMVQQGLPRLTVAGTCYEYGMQNGCLDEKTPPCPTVCYAVAKDALRRFLEALGRFHPFRLRWARLFFAYGDGQPARSLFPQLDQALASGAESFDMSGGEQLRDYLSVEEMAEALAKVALQDRYDGVINVCSGRPVSVRRLVERRIAEKGGSLRLNLGALPYPDYEPMAYWGDATRLRQAIDAYRKDFDRE